MAHLKLFFILFGLNILFRYCAWKYPDFKAHLKEKSFTAVIRTKDGSVARWYRFGESGYVSGAGIKDSAEVVMTFKTAAIGAKLLMPPIDQLEQINALKDFVITLDGPEEEATWFTQTIMRTQTVGWKYGVSGPLWFAVSGSVQIFVFGVLAIQIKTRAPRSHTYLEVIRLR